ncbi:MAG: lycopene cyclase domain-containing protein [Candidatus Jorgensenbacteria bacterium]|nr:lycopene cyclase domain-containing protein [Candidatus Jorgensenbacteria bacterium]
MNAPYEPQLAWLLWSLFLVLIWGIVYALLKDKESKKEMLLVSLWTSLLGFTEPLFVPAYWNPPSVFDLAARTGFDIESLIFSFGIGGIAVVIYERIFRTAHERMTPHERHLSRHRYHLFALLSAPVIFFLLLIATSLNPIYSAAIAMVIGGLFAWYCRPDLKKKMLVSAMIFLGIYFVYFLTLIAIFPGYVEQVWNLKDISGILILGIPLEELMFAISFGFLWSSIYEHFTWRKIENI